VKRPCTPCAESGRSEECLYGRGSALQRVAQKSRPAGTALSPPSYKSELSRSSLSRWTSKDLSLFNRSLTPSDTGGSVSSYSDSTLSCISSGEPATPGEFGPQILSEGFMSEVVLFREAPTKPRDYTFATAASFSIHPFIRLHSIPRELQIPLSFINPELLRVSDATPSELNLSLYVFSPRLSSHTVWMLKAIHESAV
jgi:hypothetical protein